MQGYLKILFFFISLLLISYILRPIIYPIKSYSIYINSIENKSSKKSFYNFDSLIQLSQNVHYIQSFLKHQQLSSNELHIETIYNTADNSNGFYITLHSRFTEDKSYSLLTKFFKSIKDQEYSKQKVYFNKKLSKIGELIKSNKLPLPLKKKVNKKNIHEKQLLEQYELDLQYDSLQSYLSSLKKEFDLPDNLHHEVIWLNPDFPLHLELITLEHELTLMLTKYLPANPKVIKIKEQIHKLKNSLAPNYQKKNIYFKPIEPIKQELIKEYLKTQAKLHSIKTQMNSLKKGSTNKNESTHTTHEAPKKNSLEPLIIERTTITEEFLLFKNSFHNSFAVSSVATPANKNRSTLYYFFSFLVSSFLSLLFKVYIFKNHRSIHTVQDVHHYLKLPVFGLVPSFKYYQETNENTDSLRLKVLTKNLSQLLKPLPINTPIFLTTLDENSQQENVLDDCLKSLPLSVRILAIQIKTTSYEYKNTLKERIQHQQNIDFLTLDPRELKEINCLSKLLELINTYQYKALLIDSNSLIHIKEFKKVFNVSRSILLIDPKSSDVSVLKKRMIKLRKSHCSPVATILFNLDQINT